MYLTNKNKKINELKKKYLKKSKKNSNNSCNDFYNNDKIKFIQDIIFESKENYLNEDIMLFQSIITLNLQNYYPVDIVFYIKTMSLICLYQKNLFDADIHVFNASPDDREMYLVNRYKDTLTRRVFINGQAVSLSSITHKGSYVNPKYRMYKKFDSIYGSDSKVKNSKNELDKYNLGRKEKDDSENESDDE